MVNKKVLSIFVLLVFVYLWQAYSVPPDAAAIAKYNLTESQASLLRLTVILPLIIIWGIAFYGYNRFWNYAHLVKKSTEGVALSLIAKGLLALALWLPLTSVISNFASYLDTQYPALTGATVIINNYLHLVVVLVAFIYIHRGSHKLVATTQKKQKKVSSRKLAASLSALLGIVFVYLTFFASSEVASDSSRSITHFLPDPLLLITVMLPYVAIFYLALRAVEHIYAYRKQVQGIIYRRAINYLALGIGFAVLSVMVLRLMTILSGVFFSSALHIILAMLYCLILLIAIGFGLIALGAKKLQKIEEI